MRRLIAACAALACATAVTAAGDSARFDVEAGAGREDSSSPLLRLSEDGALVQIVGLSRLAGPVGRLAVDASNDWALTGPLRLSLTAHGETRWSPSSRSLNLGAALAEAGLRWQMGTGSIGVSPSLLLLSVANRPFRAADSIRFDWSEVDVDGGMRALRVESGRYRHAAAAIESIEIAAGVRNERNRRSLPDLSNRGAHASVELGWKLAGGDWTANALWQVSRFRAPGPDGLGVRRDRFLSLDVTAEWPLSQRLALRTSLATSDNRSQPVIYNNRRHAVDIALVARW
ncbi:hypothetical protein [Casimicrobium huifangae]|uniref:hypothetical protein n=1 Tax=Casimicrobium huifangae TaxID=2591109 RepID=UPI003782DB14